MGLVSAFIQERSKKGILDTKIKQLSRLLSAYNSSDIAHPDRPKEMQEITEVLISAFQSKGHNIEFETAAKRIEKIQQQFYDGEKLLWRESQLKEPDLIVQKWTERISNIR